METEMETPLPPDQEPPDADTAPEPATDPVEDPPAKENLVPENTGTGGVLTDGTGISQLTTSKVVKDLVADFLLTASAALLAVNISSVDAAAVQPTVVLTAVGGALIRVVYRAALKWATT